MKEPTEAEVQDWFRDAIAMARAIGGQDLDGAREIYCGRSAVEQMGIVISLANLLALIVEDSEEGWQALLAIAEGRPL
jgi:hypothetical protein